MCEERETDWYDEHIEGEEHELDKLSSRKRDICIETYWERGKVDDILMQVEGLCTRPQPHQFMEFADRWLGEYTWQEWRNFLKEIFEKDGEARRFCEFTMGKNLWLDNCLCCGRIMPRLRKEGDLYVIDCLCGLTTAPGEKEALAEAWNSAEKSYFCRQCGDAPCVIRAMREPYLCPNGKHMAKWEMTE